MTDFSLEEKLDKEHRDVVLPVIVRLLQSKLLRKRGAINKKGIDIRRNIIYSFFQQLRGDEFDIFFSEVLLPLERGSICN